MRTGRIMRSLASNHTVAEVGENLFAANNTTKALATPAGTGGIAHGYVLQTYNLTQLSFQILRVLVDKLTEVYI